MMLKRLGWCAAICLLLTAHVAAQTAEPDTFPVEQRCVGEPTQPPADWTYPGMILMSGYAGIHAMQADWETPHVVAQFTMDQQGNVPIDGGQLSPDQDWYALPMGEVLTEVSLNQFWLVRALRIFDLTGDNHVVSLDLSDHDHELNDYTAHIFAPVIWMDSQSLIVGALRIRPFDQIVSDAPFFTMSLTSDPKVFSPDVTRLYGTYDTSFDQGVFDLSSMNLIVPLYNLIHVSWRPDSSGFMGKLVGEDQNWRGLAYYDRNGELIDRILQLDGSMLDFRSASGRSEQQWSPDGRYFLFVLDTYFSPRNLYLIDMDEQVAVDTCVMPLTPPVWSPDGTMFAYLTDARDNLNLVVVDTETWQAYIVARHSRAYGLFGIPEMVGWRSTSNEQ